ncbi:hypothetical protein [uncultured Schumannella sp.]|uniref:hypothetical protein n=1 Tax=uncultured Schumannella sp. TaxID=1195956 RepID=UPI0025D1CF63|nr:hypothetical protein [uncultured Schumannella sp.]
MTPKPRYRRALPTSESEAGGPLIIPVVEFTVHEDGSMTVTIDGAPHNPPPFAPGWRRDSFPTILDDLAALLQTPLRVHVREADGSTFTDIITPPRARRTEPLLSPDWSSGAPVPRLAVPVVHQVSGAGFVPGEDVAVAIIHAHSDAAGDGTARALLTSEQVTAAHTGEVILFGRISGTLVIGRPE